MICINLLRISTDSKYIEFSVECPTNYVFNKLWIKKYDYTPDPNIPNDNGWKDCSSLLQGATTKEVMRITTTAFGGSTMFYVLFGVQWVGPVTEPTPTLADATGACSDVNAVYANMLDLVLKLDAACIDAETYNTLLRNQMFLYAHTEAMRLERYSEAEEFYDLLKNLFTNCGPTMRQQSVITNGCNCK